jgi:hypothetical protein
MPPSSAPTEYMLLYRGQDWDQGLTEEEIQDILTRSMAWFEAIDRQGKVKASQALDRTGCIVSHAKVALVTDGPFAESKEAIGGYLLLQGVTYEEAVAIAKSSPNIELGISVEVRPVLKECSISKRLRERQAATVAA